MHRLQRRHLGIDRQKDGLGHLEDPQHAFVEDRAGVDDDGVIPLEQRAEDVRDVVGRDQLGCLG